MDTHYLASIDLHTRINDHPPTFLQVEQGIRQGLASAVGDQDTIIPPGNITGMIGAVMVEYMEHQARTCRERAEL